MALLMLMVGCAGDPPTPTPPLPTDTPTATPTSVPMMAWPTSTRVGTPAPISITVAGQVRSISTTTRVIRLAKSVQGISTISLNDKTQIVSSTGSAKKLQDLKAGTLVEATGTAGASGSLLAQKVKILPPATPTPAPKRVPTAPVTYERVVVEEINVTLNAPAGWTQQDGSWSWSRPESPTQRVGIAWLDRAPGAEPTVMLPPNGVVKSATPLDTSLGRAVRYVVNVYQTPKSGGGIVSVDTHVVIMTDQRFIDLYASGKTSTELNLLSPILQRMQGSLAWNSGG